MHDIRGDQKGRSTETLPYDGSVSFVELRDRVQRLRALLEEERRLMAEAFPHERRKREEQAEGQAAPAQEPTEQTKGERERKEKTRGRERKLHVVS